MIRNEREYKEAIKRLREEEGRLAEYRHRLEGSGLDDGGIKRSLDPLRSFNLQLKEEVESYERLKRGDIGEIVNLRGLGQSLIALRIARGLTQQELAQKLEVHPTQVSRDERNEYHGVTMDRAAKILEALGAELVSKPRLPIVPYTPEEKAALAPAG